MGFPSDCSLQTIKRFMRSSFDTDKLARLEDAELVEVRNFQSERRHNHRGECSHYFDYQDAKTRQQQLEAEHVIAAEVLFGELTTENPGAISTYERHRRVEQKLAEYLCDTVMPHLAELRDYKTHRELELLSYKLLFCRRLGPFGINGDGKLVIAWNDKCGSTRYCPDEAREESLRLKERYVPERACHDSGTTVLEHVARGGRVYKAVISPPNYPGGRLREGMRHELKRFRDRAMRALAGGRNKFGIEGALVILEAPLGRDRDWNVHLNVLLLTRGWFNYKAFQAAFAPCSFKVREHTRFDDTGIARLFNELFKYALRTVPEKSADSAHQVAPALTEWTPGEFLEWHRAHKGFRRTRAYGCLHGVGKPEKQLALPTQWIGKLVYQDATYRVDWASSTFALAVDEARRHFEAGDLFLIRGDKSTTKNRHQTRAPP